MFRLAALFNKINNRLRSSYVLAILVPALLVGILAATWCETANAQLVAVFEPQLDADGLPEFDPVTGDPIYTYTDEEQAAILLAIEYWNSLVPGIPHRIIDFRKDPVIDPAIQQPNFDVPVFSLKEKEFENVIFFREGLVPWNTDQRTHQLAVDRLAGDANMTALAIHEIAPFISVVSFPVVTDSGYLHMDLCMSVSLFENKVCTLDCPQYSH
jgi:hypothetical protein